MRIGVPTEVKNNEFRVAITPAGAMKLTRHGHDVVVHSGAGLGSSISDAEYIAAGAHLRDTAEEVWGFAEMVLKVTRVKLTIKLQARQSVVQCRVFR